MKQAAWLSVEVVLAEIFADNESDRFSENSDSDNPDYVWEDGNGCESETDGNISDDLSDHGDADMNVHHGQGDGQPICIGAAGVGNNAMPAAPDGPVAMPAAPAVHRPGPADPVYLDNYYNSVALAKFFLEDERKVHVCGTLQLNRGAPRDQQQEADHLQRRQNLVRPRLPPLTIIPLTLKMKGKLLKLWYVQGHLKLILPIAWLGE
ncbi:unnamed protein product [Acanthosepion pharaonis]|uniref:PiggyBac transposable element-derived protein domain-containing protein n=1 Tax=Acanthosepion pharaonis TaxID=158019 RepID=A0A812B5T6_ACAPH|nr:unnamed protein product [Sepia pharaonis]